MLVVVGQLDEILDESVVVGQVDEILGESVVGMSQKGKEVEVEGSEEVEVEDSEEPEVIHILEQKQQNGR